FTVVIDEAIRGWTSQLDVLVDRDALDDGQLETCVDDLGPQLIQPVSGPCFSNRHVVEGANDGLYAGDLSDVREADRGRRPEPPKGHFHRLGVGGPIESREGIQIEGESPDASSAPSVYLVCAFLRNRRVASSLWRFRHRHPRLWNVFSSLSEQNRLA